MAEVTDNIYMQLMRVQGELVAPREINGRFGKARSAEQILEAAKPVCRKHHLLLFTSDTWEEIGGRNYCTTHATVVSADNPDQVLTATASAWENEVSGGLDTSQVSGKTSSYAKKYALQNLFAIDDTKDADFDDPPSATAASTPVAKPSGYVGPLSTAPASDKQKALISDKLAKIGVAMEEQRGYLIEQYGVDMPLTKEGASFVIEELIGGQSSSTSASSCYLLRTPSIC